MFEEGPCGDKKQKTLLEEMKVNFVFKNFLSDTEVTSFYLTCRCSDGNSFIWRNKERIKETMTSQQRDGRPFIVSSHRPKAAVKSSLSYCINLPSCSGHFPENLFHHELEIINAHTRTHIDRGINSVSGPLIHFTEAGNDNDRMCGHGK